MNSNLNYTKQSIIPGTNPSGKTVKSKRKYLAVILKAAFTIISFLLIAGFVSQLLIEDNDAFKRRNALNALPQNSVDILIIGNSHAFTSLIPEKIQSATGLTTYNAAMPSQVLDLTWYNLELLLQKQSPKLVVLEAFAFQNPSVRDAFNDSNIDSMPFGATKLSAIYNIYKEPKDRYQLLFSIYRQHGNWSNIEVLKKIYNDFKLGKRYTYLDSKGYYELDSRMTPETVAKLKSLEPSQYVYKAKVTDYNKMYFDKIYNACKERGIKLVTVMAPMNKNFVEKTNYDRVHQEFQDLFNSKGVEFVDYNLLYDKINMKDEDFADEAHDAHHVNKYGAAKISDDFAEYLKNYLNK